MYKRWYKLGYCTKITWSIIIIQVLQKDILWQIMLSLKFCDGIRYRCDCDRRVPVTLHWRYGRSFGDSITLSQSAADRRLVEWGYYRVEWCDAGWGLVLSACMSACVSGVGDEGGCIRNVEIERKIVSTNNIVQMSRYVVPALRRRRWYNWGKPWHFLWQGQGPVSI